MQNLKECNEKIVLVKTGWQAKADNSQKRRFLGRGKKWLRDAGSQRTSYDQKNTERGKGGEQVQLMN